MAVKTVNAQGYDAVMAAKSAAAAAKNVRTGTQNFGELLNKAGDKAVYSENAPADDAQAKKSLAGQDVRKSRSQISAGGQKLKDKPAEAADVREADNEQTAAAEKSVKGSAEKSDNEATLKKTETQEPKAEAQETKAQESKAEGMPDAEKAAETGEIQEEPVDKMAIAQISDALTQIIEQIKELLGISDEELLLGLEKADLKLTDLLDAAGMSKLLVAVAGEGNVMNLVTNEELYAKLQELTKTVETVSKQLLEDLGLTQEEFDAMLAKLAQPENSNALKNAVINQQDLSGSQDLSDLQTESMDEKAVAEGGAGVKDAPEKEIAVKIAADAPTAVKTEAKTMPDVQAAADAKVQIKAQAAQSPETQAQPAAETETKAAQEMAAEADTKTVQETVAETDAKAVQAAAANPINEDEKALDGEEAKAADADEGAGIATETKQPQKADTEAASADNAAKKQSDSTAQNQQNDTVNVGKPQAKAHKSDTQEGGGSNSQKSSLNNFGGQPNAQGFDSKLGAIQTAAETLARYTSENTQGILRQLADIVRVARNENLTQMEMQLHPASLGTVNVSLATKAGVVTAEFTTQNEAAKAAIEANAAQLIKNLEEQGVKVEAVEVSVAGHQLEKNLDENNRNDQNRQEQEEAQRVQGSRRNSINFNSFSDDEEMLEEMQGADDATRIAMELMAANGNSMDLMA